MRSKDPIAKRVAESPRLQQVRIVFAGAAPSPSATPFCKTFGSVAWTRGPDSMMYRPSRATQQLKMT